MILPLLSDWRREELRTNLWLVPVVEVLVAVGLYFATHAVDVSAFHGWNKYPERRPRPTDASA